ncbi:hypothetical protein EHRUM3_11090, partial [Ehrlichia ruminantium]
MIRVLFVFFVVMGFMCNMANAQSAGVSSSDDDTVTKVIC